MSHFIKLTGVGSGNNIALTTSKINSFWVDANSTTGIDYADVEYVVNESFDEVMALVNGDNSINMVNYIDKCDMCFECVHTQVHRDNEPCISCMISVPSKFKVIGKDNNKAY